MVDVLERLARHADGARCDMAMLVLSDVFSGTWGDYLRTPLRGMPAREFWADARSAVPKFMLLAEVYWDMEWRLQQLGFDFTYDKRLYDRLLFSSAADVRGHLMADADYQRRSARFIENHDEPRSAAAFGDRVRAAAVVISTLPGLRFFYQGQFEGRTDCLPVHLGRWSDRPENEALGHFYDKLLAAANDDIFRDGEWRASRRPSGGDGSTTIFAWRLDPDGEIRIVVVNLGRGAAEGLVQLSFDLPGDPRDGTVLFEDQLDGQQYPWSRHALNESGLYVKLDKGAAHIFRIV